MIGRWILTAAVMGAGLLIAACSRNEATDSVSSASGEQAVPQSTLDQTPTVTTPSPSRPDSPAFAPAAPGEEKAAEVVSQDPAQDYPVAEDEAPAPSIFRSLGRALGKGLSEAISRDADDGALQP